MKTLKIILICLITCLCGIGCNNKPQIKKGVEYPDLISPIYFLDTFQIKSPRIAFVDSIPYIFSLEKLDPFENKEDFINQLGVIQYLPSWIFSDMELGYIRIYDANKSFYHLAEKNNIGFDGLFFHLASDSDFEFDETLFQLADSIQDIPVFKFVFEPKTFLLTLTSTKFNLDTQVSPIDPYEPGYSIPAAFSTDYILTIIPIYGKRDLRTINKLWYCLVTGEDPDWKYYLPDWIYNLLCK